MKKILYFSLILICVVCISGCGKKKDVVNTDSKLAAAKKSMTENLSNYSYDVEITAKTGFMDLTTNMSCKDDRINQISYCNTSTYGVETEQYIDYKNKKTYYKSTSLFGGDSSNGKWTSSKYNGGETNSWIDLSDYIFNLTEESKNDGTYYTGTIDSKKLAATMSQVDSDINMSNVVSNDINISAFVNSLNYIEKMSFTIEIMGIEEVVEINYKEFNQSGNVVIPEEIK